MNNNSEKTKQNKVNIVQMQTTGRIDNITRKSAY